MPPLSGPGRLLLCTHGKEEVKHPLRDIQQSQVILFDNLDSLRSDVLQQGRQESYVTIIRRPRSFEW